MKRLKLIGAALGAVGVLLSLLLPRPCEQLSHEAPPTMVEDLRSERLPCSQGPHVEESPLNWYQEDYFFSVLRVRPKILPAQSERETKLGWWFSAGIGPSVRYESMIHFSLTT